MKGWKNALEQRGIAVIYDINRKAAAQVLLNYAAQRGSIYISRKPAS